ncbi:hypothetical protein GCM10020219_085460 [Nonomuraea dietziae]
MNQTYGDQPGPERLQHLEGRRVEGLVKGGAGLLRSPRRFTEGIHMVGGQARNLSAFSVAHWAKVRPGRPVTFSKVGITV